jgi:tetratricopeptide (TPR) repeat protein
MDDFQNTDPALVRAEELVRAGCCDEAIVLYRELIRNHPEDDSYLLALAWVCHDGGRKDEALSCFRELFEKELQRKVFSGFAFDELVRLYKENGSLDLLVDICERAVNAQTDDFALLGDLGDAYLRAGRGQDAIGIFEKMIDMEPDASAVYCSLGNAFITSGALQKAQGAYEKAVEIEPEQKEAFFSRLTDAYLKAGHVASAEGVLRKCLQESESPLLYLDLADLLIETGRIEEGKDQLSKAVKLNPQSEGVFCNRFGNSLARTGRHDAAIAYFQQAIKADPQNPFYYMHLAASCTAVGREDLAAAMFAGADLS